MTQQEYAEYLFEILGEEPRLPDDYHGWEDFFWGLFQSFMPNGEGVAAVFEPLERGQELLERILPVYQATAECSAEILDSGNTPAFFYRSTEGAKQVSINGQTLLFPPSAPKEEDARARQTGERLLERLREFAIFYGDEELIETLTAVRRICFGLPKKDFNEADELFYEIFYQWRQDNIDPDSPEQVLAEAYYSIYEDEYLAAYLQYPIYDDKPDNDFLRPYFDLWQQGYGFALGEDCLYLYLYR